MNAEKEKLGYREGLRYIGENLVELIWLLFAAYQWIIVIFMPLALISGISELIFGKIRTPEPYSEEISTPTGTFLIFLGFFLFVAFAFYYVFKIRKKAELSTQHKFYIMLFYMVICLLLIYRVELSEKDYILHNLRYSETTVRLYDSDSKEKLERISWIMPGRTKDSILPVEFITEFSPDHDAIVRLIDIKPIEMEFSAPGYQRKKVFVGAEEGEQTISVYLDKEKPDDPNSIPTR